MMVGSFVILNLFSVWWECLRVFVLFLLVMMIFVSSELKVLEIVFFVVMLELRWMFGFLKVLNMWMGLGWGRKLCLGFLLLMWNLNECFCGFGLL